MGIGGGIFLIAIGAILVWGVRADLRVLDLHVIGWVLILTGILVLALTLWFWNDRRRRGLVTVVEETKIAHDQSGRPVQPEPPDSSIPPPPSGP
ncbi:DUF6458 family protein [Rhizomonospora bruguierae]|uniref:DUF6458 family protein n=1 Tax=Rhizomonospora bruguierae TaxID=1581705 RepID=UPI001BD00AC0|nr:DUF6458 family protein [Micromonospora sp. NBRC 107566]